MSHFFCLAAREGGIKTHIRPTRTMNKQARSRKSTAKQSARLGAYLAAGLGASTVATPTADAAIVIIDIGPTGFNIGGVNGGLAPGGETTKTFFPFFLAGNLGIWNHGTYKGLSGEGGLEFAILGGYSTPRNFALNETIDGIDYFSYAGFETGFRDYVDQSPNFGAGSYMGFKTATDNFGWLEVTWDSATQNFQILSGAYEDQVGVAILAGQTAGPAAVPEPGTWAAAALLAGGAAFARWRKRRDEAQKEAA